jgi:acyl carrier protein
MSVAQGVRDFILQNFLFTEDQSAIADDDSFLAKGIVDSTGMLEIIHFLEDEYGITIEEQEMVPENLDSVNNIVAFVTRKTP